MVRFGVDDIPNTTQLIDQNGQVNYDRITTFSAADYGFLVSYAKEIGEKGLSVGGNAKVIYRQVGDMARAWGFGVDVGAQYQFGKWQVGAVGRDITSTFIHGVIALTLRPLLYLKLPKMKFRPMVWK